MMLRWVWVIPKILYVLNGCLMHLDDATYWRRCEVGSQRLLGAWLRLYSDEWLARRTGRRE